MEFAGGDQQPSSLLSICHVRASELYPKATMQVEDSGGGGLTAGSAGQPLTIPFTPVCGEAVEFLGRTADGVLALSNYRLFLLMTDGSTQNIPIGLIEQVEVKDIFYLHVLCKDARSVRLIFLSNDVCLDWFRRLLQAIAPPKSIDDLFAFSFYAWSSEEGGEKVVQRLKKEPPKSYFRSEVERLQFDVYGAWRISKANEQGKLCASYPRELLVPSCISDEILSIVARFRSYKRVPAVVWRHTGNGAVLARCSQPEVGWLGWRSKEDEDLLKAVAEACACDRGHSVSLSTSATLPGNSILPVAPHPAPSPSVCATVVAPSTVTAPVHSVITSVPTENGCSEKPPSDCNGITPSGPSSLRESLPDEVELPPQGKKLLIMDARSYTTAVANRARGGGCECPEYYPSCEIQFMNLANIHSIRKSFHSLRALCASSADQLTWLSLLEGTRWLQHMSGLMRAAVTVAQALDREGRPVVVHCSDGWDRTPQIVALAEILLDPYYRTMQGFQVLCEREWLDFGHKFADRCGHSVDGDDHNERCPVFLQWLDCIHQLLLQFPCYFEFSDAYLVKLVQHTYSNLFGTFLCNSSADRVKLSIAERTFSVWQFLQADCFKNHLYLPKDQVLWPSCNIRDLKVWTELYSGSADHATSALSSPPTPLNANSTVHSAPGSVVGSSSVPSGDASDTGDNDESEPSSGLAKTRSYDDIIAACDERDAHTSIADQPRRCSDSSINIDLKFVNGGPTSVTVESDKESRENCEACDEQSNLEHEQLESELCNATVGLDLSTAESDAAPGPVTSSDETSTLQEPFKNGSREDLTDDEDNEVTVTTDVTESVDTVDSCDRRTNPSSQLVDSYGDCAIVNDNEQMKPASREDSSLVLAQKMLAQSVDSLAFLASQSVDSSTDTLIAPDHVANHISSVPAIPSLCNGASSSFSLTSSTFVNTVSSSFNPSNSIGLSATTAPPPPPPPAFPYSSIHSSHSAMPNGVSENDVVLPNSGDACRVCANSRRFLADNHRDPSGSSSRYSTPPLHSRTPSGGYPATPNEEKAVLRPVLHPANTLLDDVDGLAIGQSDVQIRLQQMISEHKALLQETERHLHLTLMALAQQVRHQCSHAPADRNDDVRSLPESGCSGEPPSAGESAPSDISWEAVEDISDRNPILWFPDHATSRCMNCNVEFSLVRRRHHCRNCGRIFCAECSDNNVPIPSEQLYEPVRVCVSCFSTLRPDPVENVSSTTSFRRNGQVTNVNNFVTTNGHSNDVPTDMAESALTTFALHRPTANGNSCGFSYAAVTSGSMHPDQRHSVNGGTSLADGKLTTHPAQAQPRKAAASYV